MKVDRHSYAEHYGPSAGDRIRLADTDLLVRLVKRIREHYNLTVYLEPGEAIAIGTGILVSRVVDTVMINKSLVMSSR